MKWHLRSVPFTLIASVLVVQMTGCSSDDSTTPSDTTAPTVSSTNPADGSTAISTSAAITVTFSEPLSAASANATTFTLRDSGDHATAGTVTTSGSTVTFTPASSLDHLTTYTATLTTGIKDVAGNALAANHVWRFTTVTTPSPLISAATLKEWVDNGAVNRTTGDDRVVVLDVGSATYAAGHIPGAQLVAGTDIYRNRQEGPAVDVNMVLDGASMDALVASHGIDDRTTVVFTTTGASILSATRAYWMFRYWGFPKEMLKLLDGLNAAWTAAGYALVTDAPTITPSTYSVKSNAALRSELRASLSEMIAVASGSVANAVILDARTAAAAGSYAGIAGTTAGVFAPGSDFVVFEGRMTGAQALDYKTMYNATTFQFETPGVLTAMFATVGIDGTKTTYAHCRTGVIASLPFFVLDAILGWPVANYDGSWSQWGQLSADSANGGILAADSPWRTDIPALSEVITYNHATWPVELLTLNGASCSGTLSTAGAVTYTPAGCAASFAPESNAASGNQIEEEDAAYMTTP